MSKEKEIMLNILELYKDMPYLWDKNDKHFMNKNVRHEGFEVLLNLYKTVDVTATTKTLKKKIDNLKTNYYKEVKKVKESKHTGAGNEDVYVPTIWYYDSLSFLQSTTESCRSVRATIENEDSSLSCSEDTQSTTSKDSTFKRKKKDGPLKQQHDILEKASNLMNTKEEDWEILGRCIGMQLKYLNKSQHTIACKLISDVIFYGTLNKLSEESFVGLTLASTKNYQATSRPSYPPFMSSQPSSSQSEFHPPVHTSSLKQRIQSPFVLPPTHYPVQSPDFSSHSSPFQYQTQSQQPSPSTQSNSRSVNSSTVQYIAKVPQLSVPPPPQSIELHISSPSTPASSSTPNLCETNDSVSSFNEGKADVMKDFMIFCNKKK